MLFFIFLPFINFIILTFFGRFLTKIGVIYITIYYILILVSLNFFLFYLILILDLNFFFNFGVWFEFDWLTISWEFMLDPLSVVILIIVSLVSSIVHIYSFYYIKFEPHFIRFISYLSLFTFFIFILVTSANFILLFIGWEGVGICSFCLINFWSTRIQANKAAIKAILINRIGDIGFLFAFILIFSIVGTVDFGILQLLIPTLFFIENPELDLICIFLLIGIVGKSAQIGLHTWLPAAIEGPTPVSALIHAATMVTAGVFLLIRTCFLFELSPLVQTFITILGVITALLSAITAIFLYDLKRIIAYSTCSQLGYMIIAAGLSQYSLSIFHLINHAFFKALLFLSAGAIIHSYTNEQDVRKLSSLFLKIPFLYSSFLVGNIAIIGIPFLAGFYSKDLIIELTYLSTNNIISHKIINLNLLFALISLATCFTAIYSFRIFYFLFIRTTTFTGKHLLVVSQSRIIQFSLFFLALGSIFSGYFLSELFIASNSFFYLTNELSNRLNLAFFFENEFFLWYVKLLPFILNTIIIFLGLIFTYIYSFYWRVELNSICSLLYKFILKFFKYNYGFKIVTLFQNNFYFNETYNYYAYLQYEYYYINIFRNLDKGSLEYLGPKNFSKLYFIISTKATLLFKDQIVTHFFLITNSLNILFLWLDNFI